MSAESMIVKSACVGVGGIMLGFQGLKKVFGAGHSVANGVRKVADGIDTVSDWGEGKCDSGIVMCEELQAQYEKELEDMLVMGEEATVAQKKAQEKAKAAPVFHAEAEPDDAGIVNSILNVTPEPVAAQ